MTTDIQTLLAQLHSHASRHEKVGPRLTDAQIAAIDLGSGLKLPPSYVTFLLHFGDGAYWLYGCQAVDSVQSALWLKSLHPEAPVVIPIDGGDPIPMESLLCLMSEDSNGGSWCWLTSQPNAAGEWPLAYYHQFESRLFYKLPTFAHWLNVLVMNQTEVIRVLDEEDKLGLG